MTLDGRGVLITGAKRIGAAIAIAIAREGADVAIAFNRSRDEAERCAEQIRQIGRRATVLQADVAQPEACEALVADAVRDLGRLDVLIHLASIYDEVPFEDLDAAGWDRQMNVDLRAGFLCARAVVPAMRAQGGGRIILFSDWVAASGRPRYRDYVGYYVAKAGVIALAQALALELAGDRILVNAIAPGPILAPPDTSEAEMRAVERATPLGRWGGPHEIVKAVLALIDTDFITGETIRVDGGRHLH